MMTEAKKQEYINRMVENLPVLRAKLKLTQKDLAEMIGVTNYSISGMEKGQRKMTWNTFMSLLPVFLGNEESAELVRVFGIYTPEIEAFLRFGVGQPISDEELEYLAAAGTPYYQSGGRKSPFDKK